MSASPAAIWNGKVELTSSFSHREFRALWAAGALSSIAQWTLLTARSALAFHLQGNSSSVGLVVFASMVPYVFVPPIAGVIADRFSRRTVVMCTLGVSLLTALLMALLVFAGRAEVWHLFVLSLINGSARSVEMPASQAMVPGLVPEQHLLNAVALTGVVTHGSRFVGPFLNLIILGPIGHGDLFTVGVGSVFLLAGVMYVCAIWQFGLLRRPVQYAHPAGEGAVRQFVDGVRYSVAVPAVAGIMLLVMFHCGLTMSYDALMPMYADEHLGHGGGPFSLLIMSIGAGSMAGTLALAGVSARWHRGRMLLVTALVSGLSPAALALAMAWPPALVTAAAMGATQAMFMSLTNAFLQTATPDRYRGRVLSLYLMLGGGVMAFGNLAAGGLGDRFGVAPMLALPAVSFTAVVLLTLLGTTYRGMYRQARTQAAVA